MEETEALVQGMESEGFGLTLFLGEGVTLDIKTLTSYSGQGQCYSVDYSSRYKDDLNTWAMSKNWIEDGGRFERK